MALHKRSNTPKAPAAMPFPGESPTVSLALAAGQMYGTHPEEETAKKPARKKHAVKKAKSKAR